MLRWTKNSLIQILFVSFAVVFTVMVAQVTISRQFNEYYEEKLVEKAETLSRNAAFLFSQNIGVQTAAGMSFVLDAVFPGEGAGTEIIRYALFIPDGQVAATNIDYSGLELPSAAVDSVYTYVGLPAVRSFHPVLENDVLRYILMVYIDDTPFLDYSRELSDGLRRSLIRGCLMMVVGYLLFSFVLHLRNDKKRSDEESEIPHKSGISSQLGIQLAAMVICAVFAVPFVWRYIVSDGAMRVPPLVIGGLLVAAFIVHLLRILILIIGWYFRRTISSYAAQAIQFFTFLVMFLSLYCFSLFNGYSTQIELRLQDELRTSAIFASLSLSGGDGLDDDLLARVEAMGFGEHSQGLIIIRTEAGFAVLGDDSADISDAEDLFIAAWEAQAVVMGIRGDYKYGATVIVDGAIETKAVVAVRQPASIQADELRSATVDFLLVMSATVFAFVFLFTETIRMLEVVDTPLEKQGRDMRYAKGVRGMMFLANASRHIPLFFFVRIVLDMYEYNPASRIPSGLAVMLPISVVLLVMAVGNSAVSLFVRLKARLMMILGCVIGVVGFMTLHLASSTLPVFLLILTFTYIGIALAYNGLWNFASDATRIKGLGDIAEQTLSGEYLGAMAGAVIGAMVFDKFGLFAAFTMSAAVLLVLAVLIRVLLPEGGKAVKGQKGEIGFSKFFFSRRVFIYMFLLLMPFVLGEFFIDQFSPLYAEHIALSPGAASWTALLMTLTLAYIGPKIVRLLAGRIRDAMICIFANMIAACGLILFAAFPGIATMYAASALIGVSIGVGTNIIFKHFTELKEVKLYSYSRHMQGLFRSFFGLIGAGLFTLVHFLSPAGEYVMAIAGIIVATTIIYLMFD